MNVPVDGCYLYVLLKVAINEEEQNIQQLFEIKLRILILK